MRPGLCGNGSGYDQGGPNVTDVVPTEQASGETTKQINVRFANLSHLVEGRHDTTIPSAHELHHSALHYIVLQYNEATSSSLLTSIQNGQVLVARTKTGLAVIRASTLAFAVVIPSRPP